MKNFKNKILKNFKNSLSKYDQISSSKHWRYNNKKKIKLFKINNLKNFRNNNLSYGLDDQFYSKNEMKINFKKLIKECGRSFVSKYLNKKNIGNVKDYLKYNGKIVDKHEIFHIQYLHEISKKIKFHKKNYICEIGAGYGSFASKIIKKFKCKYIIIDLPEANFLSAYYLKKKFPKKKILLSIDIKKKIRITQIKKYDIFILNPWDDFPSIKVDFFINTRSMMEMDYKIINYYFKLIKNKISKKGYFLNINRYYKDTVGYPVELTKYPYDNKWKVIISKKSWQQSHIHFLLTQRTNKILEDINNELSKIDKITNSLIKRDPRLVRRVMPNFIYKKYKSFKHYLKF